MKEIYDILKQLETKKDRQFAIATVVKIKGSTYRRPGARMLMTEEGEMIGSISGGCLEEDVWQRVQNLAVNNSQVIVYDMTADDDIVWGLGLGCNGAVYVLIEKFCQPPKYLKFIHRCITGENGVLATVFETNDHSALVPGDRFMFLENGNCDYTKGNQTLQQMIEQDAREVLRSGRSRVKNYCLDNKEVEVLVEILQPIPLIIFGAGHDAIPVVQFAKDLGWQVTVVDSRSNYLTAKRFPLADHLIHSQPEDINEHLSFDNRTVAIIMTHNYLQDAKLLQTLTKVPTRYLGVLGPKRRTAKLLAEIKADSQLLERIYSPIGTDIGAESPEEIAIAIVAEIQAVLNGRKGGLLRDRKGPIHG